MRKRVSCITGIVLAFYFAFATAEPIELGKYPKVFSAGYYKVTMLRLGKGEDTVLIKVDGIDNEFDGQIYLHKRICDNTRCTNYKYETKEIPGKSRWWTIQSQRSWGNYDSMIFYPPGIDKKHDLGVDRRPDSFDPDAFYQEYLGQKALRK